MFDAVEKVTKSESLPFPYNKSTYCRYEPIEKTIDHAKVLIVNDLLRYESDLSPLAFQDWNGTTENILEFERKVSGMACNNIARNVLRLVKNPKTMTVHLSEIEGAVRQFSPDAIVMSGTPNRDRPEATESALRPRPASRKRQIPGTATRER